MGIVGAPPSVSAAGNAPASPSASPSAGASAEAAALPLPFAPALPPFFGGGRLPAGRGAFLAVASAAGASSAGVVSSAAPLASAEPDAS